MFSNAGRKCLPVIAVAFLIMVFAPMRCWAQGCVASREGVCITESHAVDSVGMMAPVKGESRLSPRRFEISTDYRYFHSHRHFIGTEEQVQRAEQHTEVNNIVHVVDFSLTYDVNS